MYNVSQKIENYINFVLKTSNVLITSFQVRWQITKSLDYSMTLQPFFADSVRTLGSKSLRLVMT